MEGVIYYSDSKEKTPKWKSYLDQWSRNTINIRNNSSNKAILLVRIKDRIMAVTFGYGRAFLKEENIERNFGLKTVLNIIDPDKMRSINATTIEDMVVTTQRQASYSTSQNEFDLNITNDIMKGVTGEPFNEDYGTHVSGKDSLVVSVFMGLEELKDKLELYYSSYQSDRYKDIGFEWVDNVSEVRDSILVENLDDILATAIRNRDVEHLHIAPPETTDWPRIRGFCFSGINKRIHDEDDYSLNLDVLDYVNNLKPSLNIERKIHSDKLYAMNADGVEFAICNIYTALIYQTEYNGENYILCSGSWYCIDKSFFNQVNNFIKDRIPISNIALPECLNGEKEGDYNKKATDNNDDYCLFDCKLQSVLGGPKKIEVCDIFTKQKQFVHVKNKGQSAQLSHLFAQGKISAECFTSDEHFRRQVMDVAVKKFGEEPFDASIKPGSEEFEVVYAIIDDKDSDLNSKLPFFSKVNLMLTAQELNKMHYKYSVCLVKKQKC